MVFLEVIPSEKDVDKQFININHVTNIICTQNKILVYTNDGFKGKILKRFETVEERDEALNKLNEIMGFYKLK